MRRTRRRTTGAVALLLAGLLGCWTSPAAADSERVRRARDLFQEAETAYRLGAYHQALEKFEQALDLARRPSILLNIAQCHRQLGNTEQALKYYRQYLSEWERFRPGIEPPYRQEVARYIAELEAARGLRNQAVVVEPGGGATTQSGAPEVDATARSVPVLLRLDGVPSGAEVLVDGQVVQRARGGTIRLQLDPGDHLLRVRAPGYEPWQRELTLEAGEDTRYFVGLTPQKPAGSTAWLVTGICTTTLAVGAEIFAIISTVMANDTFQGSKKFDRYKAMAITGHVLAAALAVTAGVSWWLYYRSLQPNSEPTRTAFAIAPSNDGLSAAMMLRF